MRKDLLFFSLVCSMVACKSVQAQDGQRVSVGLLSGLALKKPANEFSKARQSFGMFLNYSVNENASFNFEVRRWACFGMECAEQSHSSGLFDKMLTKDWSGSISFNLRMDPIYKNLRPYVGFGAGKYYIQNSKEAVKRAKEHPEEENIDYDMRRYLGRPGFFGAVGMQFQARSKTFLFIQSKCSILFERDVIIVQPSSFTDYMSVTAGIRYILN